VSSRKPFRFRLQRSGRDPRERPTPAEMNAAAHTSKAHLPPLGRQWNQLCDGLAVARNDHGFTFFDCAHQLSQAILRIRNTDIHRIQYSVG